MRRVDREITDKKAIEEFIAKEKIIRVGFCDNGEVYIVPVNYGYSAENGEYIFYFHGASAGRKYELAKSEPSVGFEIDGGYALIGADTGCGHSAEFQSVIGIGKLSIINNEDEKLAALNCIMKQATGRNNWDYKPDILERTAVFRLKADKISCKAK
jgi:hypothetical protein